MDSQREHKVGEVATLENLLGSESGPDLRAWELGELREFFKKESTAASTWKASSGGGSRQDGRDDFKGARRLQWKM